MTIRYEANPPKIISGIDTTTSTTTISINKFIQKIKIISKKCDAIHLTEDVLGYPRVSPLEIGKIIKKEIPDLPLTTSLRVRDKEKNKIIQFIEESKKIGFSGILIVAGDQSQTGNKDLGQRPSSIVAQLAKNYATMDFYLSISNKPDYTKINKKIKANPKGFMTQVVQNIQQVNNLKDNLKGFDVIPIILYPSQKNAKSAKFLNLDLESYNKNFTEFVKNTHDITGDVLLTSPNDFDGLSKFLDKL